jgi:hypothetical protein
MMRKFFSISLLVLMLLSSVGFTIARHECSSAGTFLKVGMEGTRASCGMEDNALNCPNHHNYGISPQECCSNTTKTLSVDNYTVTSLFQLQQLSAVVWIASAPTIIALPVEHNTPFYTNDRASPLRLITRLAFICVFLK